MIHLRTLYNDNVLFVGPFYSYIFPMDARKGGKFQYSNFPSTVYGHPNILPGKIGNAVNLNGYREYISLGEMANACLSDLSKCMYGLTVAMWIKFTELSDNTYYIDSGNKGFKLFYKNGALNAEFQSGMNRWNTSWGNVQKGRWYFLELSWHPDNGIEMFVDQESVARNAVLRKKNPDESTRDSNVYIGRANTYMRNERYAAATIDDLEMWYGDRERLIYFDFIQRGKLKFRYD